MKKRTIFLIGIAGLITAGAVLAWAKEMPYRQWDSTDGTLQIVVKKRWLYCYLAAMPGQGGDAPGSVTVRDKSTGKVIMRKKVEMVNMAADELGEFRER